MDGTSVGAVSTYTFDNVTASHTINATFGQVYTITASAGSGGIISPDGAVDVTAGSSQTFTITPGGGITIADVTVDGSSVGAVSTYTFDNVTANHTITATFSVPTTTIAVLKEGSTITMGGTLDSSFSGVNDANVVQVTVDDTAMVYNPSAKYNIYGNDATESPSSFSNFLYKFDLSSIPAGATIVKAQLRLYAQYGNSGVTLAPIITHDWTEATACAAGPDHPTSPDLTWGPNSDSVFSSADYGTLVNFESCPAGIAYAVKDVTTDVQAFVDGTQPNYGWAVAQGNHGYIFSEADTPTFDPGQRPALFVSYVASHTITASADTGGTISPNGQVQVGYGDSQTFTITADTGYTIADVTVDGSSVGAVSTYTFDNVTADHTIAATFNQVYTITASAGTGGTISPTGAVQVTAGDSQTFTITPDTGNTIADVTVDGSSVGAVSTYTFDNVAADHTIAASFDVIKVFKEGATITTGGALDSSFSGVNDANVVQVTVDDTAMAYNPSAKYVIYGNDPTESPSSFSKFLYKFDLSSIPAGATIVKAQLRLYAQYGNSGVTLAPIITHDWTEATACAAGPDHPTSPALTWGPNSDSVFSSADYGTLVNFESCPAGVAYAVKDVTSDVQAFVDGTQPNYGWAVAQGNHGYIFSEV